MKHNFIQQLLFKTTIIFEKADYRLTIIRAIPNAVSQKRTWSHATLMLDLSKMFLPSTEADWLRSEVKQFLKHSNNNIQLN